MRIEKGRYRARLAEDATDLDAARRLRHQSFRAQRGLAPALGRDADGFDAACQHVLVEDIGAGTLVCCYRLLALASGGGIFSSYSAQFYDLTRLSTLPVPMLEMGRFCLHPDWHDPDILRLAWGAMTRIVDAGGVKLLFGCSSFIGSDPARHLAALRLLRERVAPPTLRPGRKAAELLDLADLPDATRPDPVAAQMAVPALLRTYLAMGGWVSDHAVIDRDLDTLHVFTAVEIDRIPAARARALRAIAE